MRIPGRLATIWLLNPIIGSIINASVLVLSKSSLGDFDFDMFLTYAVLSSIGSFIGVAPLFFCLFFVFDYFKDIQEKLRVRVKQFYWVNAIMTLLFIAFALSDDVWYLILFLPAYFMIGFYLFHKLLHIKLWSWGSSTKTFS